MKYAKRLVVGSGIAVALSTGVMAFAAAVAPPVLPAEQQALLSNGYTETASWGKFSKQSNGCQVTVELSGKNYYVVSSGKFSATLYPVHPDQVVNGAKLMEDNCQG
jgi:hypothetical protein